MSNRLEKVSLGFDGVADALKIIRRYLERNGEENLPFDIFLIAIQAAMIYPLEERIRKIEEAMNEQP